MRSNGVRRFLTCALAVPALAALLVGCSSGGKKTAGEQRAASAVTGLKQTRDELTASKTQIDKTIAAMNAMRDAQGTLATEFATFNSEIAKTDAVAQKAKARAADMRTRSAAYQTKWRE